MLINASTVCRAGVADPPGPKFRLVACLSRIGILSRLILAIVALLASSVLSIAAEKPNWQAEWEKTIKAAETEGALTIYSSITPKIILDTGVFQRKFPGIKITSVTSEGGGLFQRITTERRAERYLADIVIGGASTPWNLHSTKVLDPIRPLLILPEVIDESGWWEGRHAYVDSERQYVFMYMGNPQKGDISYNTTLINPKDFRSFWDFVTPALRGKIIARDVNTPGERNNTIRFFYYNPQLGPKFIWRMFGEMDVTLFRDRRQSVDWLANGKFAVCFFCIPSELGAAQSQGLPVGKFDLLKEGAAITPHTGAIGLMDKAPHPNAAKVFINWLLSREGQITVQNTYVKARIGVSNSLRTDIPKDIVPPDQRLLEGVKYIQLEKAERISVKPALEVFNEAIAEAQSRKKP
jgi:iron(III) transport system substrate-binding protein